MTVEAIARRSADAFGWWPGVFTARLHRVDGTNRERLRFSGRTFGIGDCGAVCVPANNTRMMRPRCARCAHPP